MALVECVGSEFLPVSPYLLKGLGVMAVRLPAIDEFGLQLIKLVLQLLTHRLTQRVALTTREVREQARQEHHLLLIDRDAVGVLQVFLHDWNIVGYRLPSHFPVDEVGDIVHRSRTVESVHGNEILKHMGLELTEIFLHAG